MRWAHLPHAAFRLLCFMAVVTKDDGDPPMFYQGQDSLAMALGMSPDADNKTRQATFRQVRRHMEVLIDAKCVERITAGAPGRNAEYALHLSMDRRTVTDPQTADADRPPSGGERRSFSDSNGGRSTAQRRSVGGTMAVGHRPPKDIQDYRTKEEDEVETAVDTSPARGRARSREAKRCRKCRTDHSGLTCAEYREGVDLKGVS